MTREQAMKKAEKVGLEFEIKELLDAGEKPEDALREWDID